jgi:hypothetical protein
MNTQNNTANIPNTKLGKESIVLAECQQKNGLDSCFKCDKLFECEIRIKYVKTVYESMSHGQGGGFEF